MGPNYTATMHSFRWCEQRSVAAANDQREMIHSADYSAGGATFLIGSIGRGWPTHRTDFSRRSSVPIPREADEHSRFELTCACVCVRACTCVPATQSVQTCTLGLMAVESSLERDAGLIFPLPSFPRFKATQSHPTPTLQACTGPSLVTTLP